MCQINLFPHPHGANGHHDLCKPQMLSTRHKSRPPTSSKNTWLRAGGAASQAGSQRSAHCGEDLIHHPISISPHCPSGSQFPPLPPQTPHEGQRSAVSTIFNGQCGKSEDTQVDGTQQGLEQGGHSWGQSVWRGKCPGSAKASFGQKPCHLATLLPNLLSLARVSSVMT